MRIHVVANPTAGRGKVPGLVRDLAARLEREGARVTTYSTVAAGDARAHVSLLAGDATDRLVVVGGDGTLHEVANALPPPAPWPVAIVPVGTANLVARDAHMPLRGGVDALARAILDGVPWTVDLLETDRGFAVATAGVGLDAEVVEAVAKARGGKAGGYARWVGPIAKTFSEYAPPRLTAVVDGKAYEGAAVVVQNARNYGGLFELSPTARMDDGVLDVVVIRGGHRRDFFRVLLAAFARRVQGMRDVTIATGTSVEIRSEEPAAVQIDGDPGGATPLSVRVRPRSFTLLRAPPR